MGPKNEQEINEMDAQLARSSFWTEVKRGMTKLVTDAPSRYKESDEYRYEQSLVKKHVKPLMWGVGCTFLLFASFRLQSSKAMQRFRRDYLGWHHLPTTPARPSEFPLDSRKDRQGQLMQQAVSIPIDLMISIALGVSATAFLIDDGQIRKDLERVPGLPGRSVLADSICPNVVKLYEATPPKAFTQGDATLQTMQTFARNCERRAEFENKVRREKGLADNEPVPLPFPGFV